MRRNTLLIAIILGLIVLLLLGRFYFSEASFSTTNPFWNSIGQFTSTYDVNNLYDLSDLSMIDKGSTLLIIGPSTNYSAAEAGQIRSYMERGGQVVVMDDFGASNTLLEYIDSPVILYQETLCQEDDYYVRPSFPIIKNFSESSLFSGVRDIYLNHPVSLNVTDRATVEATTSRVGYLDYNDNCDVNWDEQFGVYVVMASASYGDGKLLVISDPDIVTNGMLDMGNNKLFLSNLMKSDLVYVDMTHGHEVPQLARLTYILKNDLIAQLLCIIVIVSTGYAYYRKAAIISIMPGKARMDQKPMSAKESIISFIRSKFLLSESEINELKKKL